MKFVGIRNIKGMTLVEIVAATTIMAISFVAFISLFTQSSQITTDNAGKTDMVTIAQDLMEKSYTTGFGSLVSQDSVTLDPLYSSKYNAKTQVTDVKTDLKKVVVKVWRKNESEDSGISLVTLISNT